jgi:hypothetical protein
MRSRAQRVEQGFLVEAFDGVSASCQPGFHLDDLGRVEPGEIAEFRGLVAHLGGAAGSPD